jgi:hypothetical protein
MHRYDIWLTNAPEGPTGPVICTECRKRVLYDCEDLLNTPHCVEEETGDVVGTFVFDDGWDWDER